MAKPLPGHPVPDLHLPTVDGARWKIAQSDPEHFTMVVFYRGLHCPICKDNLQELKQKLGEFEQRGVHSIAVSCDSEARAKQSYNDWGLAGLKVAYDLTPAEAKAWDLYVSASISDSEPQLFCEPGMFIVDKDKTLYWSSVQSMPFARPSYDDILNGLDFILKKNYPPRGTVE